MTRWRDPTAIGAGLRNGWRGTYYERVASALEPETDFRALTAAEVEHALDQLDGARSIPVVVAKAASRILRVRIGHDFQLAIRRRAFENIAIAEVRVSAVRLRRLPFSRANAAQILLVLAGEVTLIPRQGHPLVFRAGDSTVVTDWSEFELRASEGTLAMQVVLSHSRLKSRGVVLQRDADLLLGTRTLMRPLVSLITSLVDEEWQPTEVAARIAERALEDLAVGFLIEWEGPLAAREDARALLRARAIEEITQRHRDSGLTPTVLAKYLGVSLRHLQRCFEGSGTTLVEQIASQRTASAAELLAAPGGAGLTVTELARATGFGSAFELRSAFRARYGMLPSAYRAHREHGATIDDTHAVR